MIRFCGEAPGADEEIEGAPFVGESGRMLFNAMKVAGVPSTVCPECDGTGGKYPDTCTWCRGSRRDFSRSIYVYNLCQCRPPANDFSVIQAHYPVITECQLKHVAPAPPGSTSFLVGGKALAWHFPDLTSVETWQGSLLLGEGGRRYVPTFHPAYLMRVPSLMGTLSNTISGGIQSTVPFVPQPGRIPDGPIGTLYLDVETQGFTGPLDLIGVSVDRRSVEHFDPGLANDCARLQGLLERSFGRRLRPEFFQRTPSSLYVEADYRGAAILEPCAVAPYLSKLAVEPLAQGEGIARDLWQALVRDHAAFFWRARPDNPITSWYLSQCDGVLRLPDWHVYWRGLLPEQIPAAVGEARARPEDFVSVK